MDYVKGSTVVEPAKDFSRQKRFVSYGSRIRRAYAEEKKKNKGKENKGHDGV